MDVILGPLLNMPILLSIFVISFIASLIVVVVYKLMTKQHVMKDLKSEIKVLQKEMKDLKDDTGKMMEVQKKAMQKNMEYMKHSFKPTLITFLPLILIFGWLNANLAFEPINPGQEFIVSVTADQEPEITVPEQIEFISKDSKDGITDFTLKGDEGDYILEFNLDNEIQTKEILITNNQAYKDTVKEIKKSSIKKIEINNNKLKVLNLFGWQLGWLGTYIIFSIVFSIVLRRLFKVH